MQELEPLTTLLVRVDSELLNSPTSTTNPYHQAKRALENNPKILVLKLIFNNLLKFQLK